MYPTCPRCHGPVEPGFRFCKHCGCDIAYPYAQPHPGWHAQAQPPAEPAEKQAINFLLLAMGVRYGVAILATLLSLIGGWGMMRIVNVSFSVLYIIGLLIFAILVKHKRARLFLWLFFGAEILLFLKDMFWMPFYGFMF